MSGAFAEFERSLIKARVGQPANHRQVLDGILWICRSSATRPRTSVVPALNPQLPA
jgi:hypothetical protein